MDFELVYTSPDGDVFDLLDGSSGGPFVEVDTLSGFVGEFEDTVVSSPGVPGGRVDFRDRVVAPMTGSFTLVVPSRESWGGVREAFSTCRYGTLRLVSGGRVCETPVRLSVALPSPGVRPGVGSRVQVELVSDGDGGGVWGVREVSRENVATVTNWGDVPVWPVVVWEGRGGRVVLPSGVGFTLPAVVGRHELPLARTNAGRVFGPGGEVDRALSRQVGAVSEMVPVGESREYTVPDGAVLVWTVGVFDPWH